MLSGRLWPSPGATAAQFAERKNKENRDFKVSEPAKFSGLRRSFCARPPQAGEAKISPHQLRLLRFMGITLRCGWCWGVAEWPRIDPGVAYHTDQDVIKSHTLYVCCS